MSAHTANHPSTALPAVVSLLVFIGAVQCVIKWSEHEVNGVFIRGPIEHSHLPEACPLTTSKVSKLIKDKAMKDVFRPALEIVEEVLLQHLDPTKPTASLPAR